MSRGAVVGAAAALAATAAFNAYQGYRAERRSPPKGRFIEIDGVRLHYLEEGEGPPVILIHGNIVAAEDFKHSGLVDLVVRQRHRVIAFDRPGMGHSDRPRDRLWTPAAQAELLRKACDRLGVVRPVVLGHSWGAMVAMAWALDAPDAISGLVLLGGYFQPTLRADVALAVPPAVPVLGDALCYTVSPLFGRAALPALIKGMFAPQPIPERFSAHFSVGMTMRPWQIHAMSQDGALMAPAALAMRDRYRTLTMPVALLVGDEDMVVDVGRQSERLHEELPRSSLQRVPGVGHMVHYAAPQAVAAAIDRVWEQGGRHGWHSVTAEPPPLAVAGGRTGIDRAG